MTDDLIDRNVVRLELSNAEYRRLQMIAEDEDRTETETVREALTEYLDRQYSIDSDDPFITFHDRIDVPADEHTTPAETDDDLYGKTDR